VAGVDVDDTTGTVDDTTGTVDGATGATNTGKSAKTLASTTVNLPLPAAISLSAPSKHSLVEIEPIVTVSQIFLFASSLYDVWKADQLVPNVLLHPGVTCLLCLCLTSASLPVALK